MQNQEPFHNRWWCARSISRFAVCIVLCASTTPAFAEPEAQCVDAVPAELGGSAWSDVKATTLGRSQRELAAALFRALDGRWHGDGRVYTCLGAGPSSRRTLKLYVVDMEVRRQLDDSLALVSKLTSEPRGTNDSESLRLILSKDRLRVNVDALAGDVGLLALSAHEVAFIELAGGRPGVRLKIRRRIAISGQSLVVEYAVYSQGGLSSAAVWTLTR